MDGYTRRCGFSYGSAQGFDSPRLHFYARLRSLFGFTGSSFTLAFARCLGSRSLVSRSPALAGLVLRAPARPDSDFTGASFTLACARCLGSRSLVSRSPALAGLVSRAPSRPLASRSPSLAVWASRSLVLRAPARPLVSRSPALAVWVHAR